MPPANVDPTGSTPDLLGYGRRYPEEGDRERKTATVRCAALAALRPKCDAARPLLREPPVCVRPARFAPSA